LTESEQALDPVQTFNPSLQYFVQVITERITDPSASVPEMNENI
jgi:ATP-dependent DNA helicase 2 subunit 2